MDKNLKENNQNNSDELSFETFSLNVNTPMFTTVKRFDEITSLLEQTVINIQQANNPRTIIIETWLILDVCVRELIISGLNLDDYCYSDFDLRYKLLPISFRECLNILKMLIKKQNSLPKKPVEYEIRLPIKFLLFLQKRDNEFFNKLVELEREYCQIENPESTSAGSNSICYSSSSTCLNDIEYRAVNDTWLQVVSQLDDDWFKDSEKINEVRNFAAHSFDSKKIFNALGFSGKNALIHLRNYCKNQLMKSLGMKFKEK